jgi:8-amino-7-oxononanoate synthase
MTLYLQHKLLKRKNLGNLRRLQTPQHLLDFSSNDYLGLARSSALASAVTKEWNTTSSLLNGLGSTGSRLLTGNSTYAQYLESKIAAFHGYEEALLFSCGYMANVGLLSTVSCSKDTIFFDTQVHASSHDGIRLSQAKAFPFRHNDLIHLENRLKNTSTKGNRFICIESIYSTDGSKAPLLEISQLAKKYEALLIVDEAHATGVFGPNGKGLVAEKNLTTDIFAQIVTFGKALGTYGAAILGSPLLKTALINFATSYIYTTALPLYSLKAINCSYTLFPELESERAHIRRLIQLFCSAYPSHSETHIQPIFIKGSTAVKCIAKKLSEEGFDVRALTSPTVKQGREVLRICLHSFNTENELLKLIETLSLHGSFFDA